MTAVVPTGPHGRIIERDINAALDKGATATIAAVEDFLAGYLDGCLLWTLDESFVLVQPCFFD